eukprot:TRINITY_DN961_c0_g1_i8.p1 TRINITY_DN961_c0_g1~~TRINITY_DN961_c0_g1_i8.p1  ORF type:complete len:340 (+),score=112.40 TRINITY_DN961_c0_g1_i8:69-1088(+)
MPRNTRSTASKRTKEEIENDLDGIEWEEEQEKQLKKYFAVYKDLPLEDSLHLTSVMLNPPRNILSIAKKLFQFQLLDEDKLLGHFPQLEGKIEFSPNLNKELGTKDSKIKGRSKLSKSTDLEEIIKKIGDSNDYSEHIEVLRWVSEKLQEAKFSLEFHQMTIKGAEEKKAEIRPLFEILPVEEKEWEHLKNRHVQKLFNALGMSAPQKGGFWSVSEKVSLIFLASCISSLSVAMKQSEDFEKRRKEREKEKRLENYRREKIAAMQENTMGSIVSGSSDKKNSIIHANEDIKKRTTSVRSPMRVLNSNSMKKTVSPTKISALDDIFSSPQHKRTRNASRF